MRAIIGSCGLCGGPVEACKLGNADGEVYAVIAARCLSCRSEIRGFGPVVTEMTDRRASRKSK